MAASITSNAGTRSTMIAATHSVSSVARHPQAVVALCHSPHRVGALMTPGERREENSKSKVPRNSTNCVETDMHRTVLCCGDCPP